eukprot:1440112-Amphidinium_carterae.1
MSVEDRAKCRQVTAKFAQQWAHGSDPKVLPALKKLSLVQVSMTKSKFCWSLEFSIAAQFIPYGIAPCSELSSTRTCAKAVCCGSEVYGCWRFPCAVRCLCQTHRKWVAMISGRRAQIAHTPLARYNDQPPYMDATFVACSWRWKGDLTSYVSVAASQNLFTCQCDMALTYDGPSQGPTHTHHGTLLHPRVSEIKELGKLKDSVLAWQGLLQGDLLGEVWACCSTVPSSVCQIRLLWKGRYP